MSLRPVRIRATAAALALVCLPTFGCSWIFVNKPPPGPIRPTPPLECTTSSAAPEVDFITQTVFGLGGLVVTLYGIFPPENSSTDQTATILVGVAAIGAAAALGFSGRYGESAMEECLRVKAAQDSCTSGVEDACRTLKERK
jgi:hypothetical protein